MICRACGTENKGDRRFCRNCGTALAAGCPSCGATNDPEDRFCGTCGTPLAASAAPATVPAAVPAQVSSAAPDRPTAVAERRLVTVLFADLVGFTTLAEGRDPEETRDLLSRYFDLARETIERYGGTVEKFIGDAVMAVWGAPVARENDAELCVRAALELVAGVGTLAGGLEARAGVLTGEAAVTLAARGEGMVAGDLVNTASRLQSVAPVGTVLVGEATERAAASAITFERVGDQQLKGKQSPVPAFRALRVVAEVGGRGRSEALEAPFVGRDEELRLLKDLFHATGREKRTRLISVTGPAGIGKSRLAWEFLKYVDGLVETTYWHAGRSPSYGEGLSFWALGEMVRGRCGLLETDDETTTRARVRETVGSWVPDEDERRWVESALLVLLGFGEPLAGGRDELFAAWRTFFERMAANDTVVMLFEDLHWADAGLLDFIDHVIDWTRNLPLYIVTLARPDLLDTRPSWGAGKRNFISVTLEPLDAGEMRDLLEGMVPGMPAQMVQAVVDRADGIPLYAVESVRMLVSQGRLVESEGAYRPVGDLTALAVPETLTALIAARLDGLDPKERGLLQDGAVLGQSFTIEALAAISGTGHEELEPRLRSLVKREVLRQDVHPRSPERGQYAFVQSLIREVAYNTLARPDRRARHLAAARYFEAMGGDELAGALASHYLAAHENSPAGPETDALAVQARLALRGAGDRAAGLGSNAQAVTFFEQALAVTSDPADEADLRLRAAEAASLAGDYDGAIAHAERAVEIRRASGDEESLAVALTALARVHLSGMTPSRALVILQAGVDELDSVLDTPPGIELRSQLARAYMMVPDPERAISLSDQVLAAAERADLTEIAADTLITRGSALGISFRPLEGMGAIRAGIELAEERGLTGTALRGRLNEIGQLGELDPRRVVELAPTTISLARRLGVRPMLTSIIFQLAYASYLTGDWALGLEHLDEMLTEDLADSDWNQLAQSWMLIRGSRGESITAEFERATAMLERTDEHILQTQLHDIRARIWFIEGRLADARREALASNEMEPFPDILHIAVRSSIWQRDLTGLEADYRAIEQTGAHGPSLNAQVTVYRAAIAALAGDHGDARRLYGEGRRLLRDRGLRFVEALSAIDMATLLPDEAQTADAVGDARELLRALGARPFLARLDSLTDARSRDARPVAAEA